jgi:hypothetical protein
MWSRGNSFSIISVYRLDDRAIEVRSPAEARDFSSNLCAQTVSGAHPASCAMGTGDPFPVAKARPVRDADHFYLMQRSWMSRSYTSSSPYASIRVLWDWSLLLLINVYYVHVYVSIFLTVYPCFSPKKYTGTSKLSFRALISVVANSGCRSMLLILEARSTATRVINWC